MRYETKKFLYFNHAIPHGLLPRTDIMRASACWRFVDLAQRALLTIPEQVTYEGEDDQTVRLRALLDSVSKQYDIDPNEFMVYYGLCKREAMASGLPWDSRLDAWNANAGKSYDEVTREPDRLNKS